MVQWLKTVLPVQGPGFHPWSGNFVLHLAMKIHVPQVRPSAAKHTHTHTHRISFYFLFFWSPFFNIFMTRNSNNSESVFFFFFNQSITGLVVKRIHLPMWETWVQSLSWEDPLEKEMAAHSSILAWKIPWTEKPSKAAVHGAAKSRTQLSDWAHRETSF